MNEPIECVIDVVVDVPARRVDKAFTYRVPDETGLNELLGRRVKVPFGQRTVYGYVIGQHYQNQDGLKKIIQFDGPEVYFDQKMLELAQWTAKHYLCTLIEAIRCLLPPGMANNGHKISPKREIWIRLLPDVAQIQNVIMTMKRQSPVQARILQTLTDHHGYLSWTELAKQSCAGLSSLNGLERKGLIHKESIMMERDPYGCRSWQTTTALPLTSEQNKALQVIATSIQQRQAKSFLLYGVTGSGKTEIYLQAIEQVLNEGYGAIILTPEIALTTQMVERFKRRFGDLVAVLHSRLSKGERFDTWMRVQRGLHPVVVGARSAIFAPVRRLGLIVIDEEHEFTYKQEDNPKYHARLVALQRAELNHATVVMGSATPAIESYWQGLQGEFQCLRLTKRVDDRPLPKVELVDMRVELGSGNKSVFSNLLQQNLLATIAQGHQAILLLNRRGYSTFVMCRECGHTMRCPHCSVSLTYHRNDHSLRCHYCQYREKAPDICPQCGSRYIRYFGTGTQKVQDELAELMPQARILRMDQDTTGSKFAHETMLSDFAAHKYDILLGTQMIAKGLDIPNITLVGVIAADSSLHLPDFRAGERTFQLLTQVAGRAGRGGAPGLVIVQTYNPDHYAIIAAQQQDYQSFYDQEISMRQALRYPPFAQLIKITVLTKQEQEVIRQSNELAVKLQSALERVADAEILGPAPAPVQQIQGNYRWQIIVRTASIDDIDTVLQQQFECFPGILSIDVEPVNML